MCRIAQIVTICGLLASATVASDDNALPAALQAYFETTDQAEKQALIAKARIASDGSVAAVADTLPNLALWPSFEGSSDQLTVDNGGGIQTEIVVTLPRGYDATRAYPLLVALCDRDDRVWSDSLPLDIVVARIANADHAGFDGPQPFADEPRKWLRALRRRYHLDTDRIYLYGHGAGADVAFAIAVMHSDAFAGVIIHEGTLLVPHWRELHPLLLANLSSTPLHLAWTRPDLPPNTVLRGRAVRLALMNQWIAQIAERESLPITTSVVRESTTASPEVWHHILQSPRMRVTAEPRRFRYPAQSQTRLLNVRRFSGSVWEGDQLDILTQPVTDRREYTTSVLEAKLHDLSVRIDGQTIDVQCPHCESIEIQLSFGDVDFSKRVLIRFDGKRRFSGRLTPSIETLLQSAEASWDFQHSACVRLRIGRKGSVRPF